MDNKSSYTGAGRKVRFPRWSGHQSQEDFFQVSLKSVARLPRVVGRNEELWNNEYTVTCGPSRDRSGISRAV